MTCKTFDGFLHPVLHVVHGIDIGGHGVGRVSAVPALGVDQTSSHTAKNLFSYPLIFHYINFINAMISDCGTGGIQFKKD